MLERGEFEAHEIGENPSLMPDALPPTTVSGGVIESPQYLDGEAQLMAMAPWEIALRRAVGLVLDLVIAYGGWFLYFVQSGLISYRDSDSLIHPTEYIFNFFNGWQLAFLLVLLPLPYLYLCWFFKDFRSYYTPGEMIVGIGIMRVPSENARWHSRLPFPCCQIFQIILAMFCGFLVWMPGCSFLGIILLVGVLFTSGWDDDVAKFGNSLVVLDMLREGLAGVLSHYVDMPRIDLCLAISEIYAMGMIFWVLYRENFPVTGNKLQSRSDLRFGMKSVALRKFELK